MVYPLNIKHNTLKYNSCAIHGPSSHTHHNLNPLLFFFSRFLFIPSSPGDWLAGPRSPPPLRLSSSAPRESTFGIWRTVLMTLSPSCSDCLAAFLRIVAANDGVKMKNPRICAESGNCPYLTILPCASAVFPRAWLLPARSLSKVDWDLTFVSLLH